MNGLSACHARINGSAAGSFSSSRQDRNTEFISEGALNVKAPARSDGSTVDLPYLGATVLLRLRPERPGFSRDAMSASSTWGLATSQMSSNASSSVQVI